MDASVCTTTAHAAQSALARRLIAATAALLDAGDFTVNELRASAHEAVLAVGFVLSRLPRRVVEDGLGEVFFNEDVSMIGRGGCDGTLVAMIEFDNYHAVLEAARGQGGHGDDAYLDGIAYVFASEAEARCFAGVCASKVRRRAIADALRRALELAAPLPARDAARIMLDAFGKGDDAERRSWLHELRWSIGHPELDFMRRA
jgi:hypothetical protein